MLITLESCPGTYPHWAMMVKSFALDSNGSLWRDFLCFYDI